MADEENEESRSAADIVDDMADEMGIDEEEEPDSELSDEMKDELGGLFDEESEGGEASSGESADEESSSEESDEGDDTESTDESESGTDGSVEGEEASDDSDQAASEESDDEPADEEDEVAQAIEDEVEQQESTEESSEEADEAFGAGEGQIGGVFDPDDEGTPESDADLGEDAYLDEGDLEEFGSEPDYDSRTWALGVAGGVAVLALGMLGYLVMYPGEIPRIEALARGELREYEQFQAAQAQEEFEKQQLAELPKFGTLSISGKPQYAKIELDGEVQYGETSDGHWKAVRMTPQTTFRNLRIEEDHTITVSNPGFQEETWELTEGHWEKKDGSQVDYQKALSVALTPESAKRHREFWQRMKKDPENNYFGEVTINSEPEGAKVIFDGEPLKNEDGEELKTPVTFEKYWTEKEEEEEGDNGGDDGSTEAEGDDEGELEENKVKVDMPPDKGHKIVLKMPEDAEGEYPSYVTPLQRQMWTCEWKSDREIARLDDDASYPDRCNYKYNLDVNFSDLKSYIEERKKERKRVEEQNEKIKETLKGSPQGPSN